MFEGTRLAYVVPGYTGHIPKTHFEGTGGYYIEEKPQNHIPGTLKVKKNKLKKIRLCWVYLKYESGEFVWKNIWKNYISDLAQ